MSVSVVDNLDVSNAIVDLTNKVLKLGKVEEQCEIIDWDLDRVYIKTFKSGIEYVIRTWDIKQIDNTVNIRYSLFKEIEGENGMAEVLGSLDFVWNKS